MTAEVLMIEPFPDPGRRVDDRILADKNPFAQMCVPADHRAGIDDVRDLKTDVLQIFEKPGTHRLGWPCFPPKRTRIYSPGETVPPDPRPRRQSGTSRDQRCL